MLCYFGFIWIHRQKYDFYLFVGDVKTAILLSGFQVFLTPVLKSLTVTYHDNTIIIFVVCNLFIITNIVFVILHLILYDFKMVKKMPVVDNISQSVGSPISLNAIFFATILLSSRLSKVRQVYVLLFEAMM